MNNNLSYLTDKILTAKFRFDPFKHIYIENFFSDEHFNEIINSPQIESPNVSNDQELLDTLESTGYNIIDFPGCIQNKEEYIDWHKNKSKSDRVSTSNEGFGMVLRLKDIKSNLLTTINDYIKGEAFNRAIAYKFNINYDKCRIDSGIQKYLDGYEISPHADIRLKATTFMVNINPNAHSEKSDHHTHYMKFKNKYKSIQNYWETSGTDRSWVPWDWCETVYTQSKNNSIVIFSPSNDTLHAVKASYNHLQTQRTQLYGNMWYYNNPSVGVKKSWEDLQKELNL